MNTKQLIDTFLTKSVEQGSITAYIGILLAVGVPGVPGWLQVLVTIAATVKWILKG